MTIFFSRNSCDVTLFKKKKIFSVFLSSFVTRALMQVLQSDWVSYGTLF